MSIYLSVISFHRLARLDCHKDLSSEILLPGQVVIYLDPDTIVQARLDIADHHMASSSIHPTLLKKRVREFLCLKLLVSYASEPWVRGHGHPCWRSKFDDRMWPLMDVGRPCTLAQPALGQWENHWFRRPWNKGQETKETARWQTQEMQIGWVSTHVGSC